MKYIKKVILENFQSHKYSELEFDNSLNVIVGPSDQGKSAIIRGIKWALFNEPSGDYFIREGEKDCSVTLVFSDDTMIKRYRSKSKNLYYLYDANGKETIFEGFGTNVPDEILDKINIRKIYLDGKQSNSINISDQLEGPFLLSEKTVTRANAIGRLVGVHFVDDAVADTLKDIRNLNIVKKNTEEQLIKQMEELEKYNYLDELEQTIKKLEFNKNRILFLENRVERLKILFSKLNHINGDIKETRNIVIKLDEIESINIMIKELNVKIKAYIFINNKLNTLLENKNNICYNKSIVEKIKNLADIQLTLKELEQKIEKRTKLIVLNSKKDFIEKNLNSNQEALLGLKHMQSVDNNIESIDNYSKKLITLESLRNNKLEVDKRIVYGTNYLNSISKIYGIDLKILSIEEKNIFLSKLISIKNKRDALLTEIGSIETLFSKCEEDTKHLLVEYKNLLSKFEVCPLCLSKIDQNTIKKIVDAYK